MKNRFVFILATFLSVVFSQEFFPLPTSCKEVCVDYDPFGNMIAIWAEHNQIWLTERTPTTNWSLPVPLSSPTSSASGPKVEIAANGDATVAWLEGNSLKTLSRRLGENWGPARIVPRKPIEESLLGSSRMGDLYSLPPVKMKKKEPNPLSTNALDAPSSGALRGGQIGFAAGTSAPSDGLLVSGQVGIATNSPEISSILNVSGTQTVVNSSTQASVYFNQTLTPTNGSNLSGAFFVQPTFIAPSTKTITEACGAYINMVYNSNVGTITNGFGVLIAGGTSSTGTLTNNYGCFISAPSAGSTKTALYSDNASIGYTAVTPPTNGLIVSGKTSLGSSGSVYQFYLSANSAADRFTSQFTGSQTGPGTNFSVGSLIIDTTLNPNFAGTLNQDICTLAYIYPNIFPQSGCTISQAAGLYISGGGAGGAGTTTTGYGIIVGGPGYGSTNKYGGYFNAPIGATHNCALYADNIAIGYTATTPPSNGLIVQGNVGIGVSSITSGTLQVAGTIMPDANGTRNIGAAAGFNWGVMFAKAFTVGTSRIAPSRTLCPYCQKIMMRGTGTYFTVGEEADYVPVFCLDCGTHKVEAICHLPAEKKALIKPPPEIKFLGFRVNQLSGNSHLIQICYSYGDVLNSSYFTDAEYEQFLKMDKKSQRAFIKRVGIREWESLEERRLMQEICNEVQSQLDALGAEWKETDLLKE